MMLFLFSEKIGFYKTTVNIVIVSLSRSLLPPSYFSYFISYFISLFLCLCLCLSVTPSFFPSVSCNKLYPRDLSNF